MMCKQNKELRHGWREFFPGVAAWCVFWKAWIGWRVVYLDVDARLYREWTPTKPNVLEVVDKKEPELAQYRAGPHVPQVSTKEPKP